MRRSAVAALLVTLIAGACASASSTGWRYAPLTAADPGRTASDAVSDASPASTAEAEGGGGERSAASSPGSTAPSPGGDGVSEAGADDPEAAAVSPEADDAEPVGTLEVTAFDLGFEPAAVEVDAAGPFEVTLVNDGAIPHDITFPDGTKVYAEAGQTTTGVVEIPEGGAGFICSIPGHKEAGMVGEVTVSGAPGASPAPQPAGEDHSGPAPELTVEADPHAPAPVVYDPTAPDRLEGEEHDVELVITERPMTVAKGFVQTVWTFGDTVPGPVIRVKVGDTVNFRLVNPETNQLPHSIDFHSSMVAWNDEMTSINPGEEKLYPWTAHFAGVYMYHCGTTPTLHHIANGMYGMVIVEPPDGLEPVDHEYALVQSEWYLGPQGEITSLEKASHAAADPDFVVFNGVASQYVDAPIEVPTGERVRAFVLNAGPSVDSSFHVVGTIFDRVIKEGVALELGNAGSWGSQAIDLAPAQGGLVEFTLAEDGLYPIVTHAFNYVGRGALGLFQAGDGDPVN